MSSTASGVSPTLRQRGWGIGQNGRAQPASRACDRTRTVLETMIDQRLISAIGHGTGPAARPLAVLDATARLIVKALNAAVEHSAVITIAAGKKIPAANYQELLQRKRAALNKLLPTHHHPAASVVLQHMWPAGTPVSGARCLMDSAFHAHRTRVIDAIASYASELVSHGLLGFTMESDSAPAYSYTLHTMELDPAVFTSKQTVTVNPTAPEGQRTTYTTRSKGSGTARHVTAEHVHHLGADAQTVPFDRTRVKLPQRVAAFKRQLPPWVTPYLTLTTGTITREEVHERDQYHTQWQSDVIISQWKASPALVLGEIVLAGWSDSDFASERQTMQAITSGGHAGWWLLGGIAAAVAICILFPGVAPAVARVAAGAAARAAAVV